MSKPKKPKNMKTYRTWAVVKISDGSVPFAPERKDTAKAQIKDYLERGYRVARVEIREVGSKK